MGSCNSVNHTALGRSILHRCYETREPLCFYWHTSNGGYVLNEWREKDGNVDPNNGFCLRLPAGVHIQVTDVSEMWTLENGSSVWIEYRFLDDIPFDRVNGAIFLAWDGASQRWCETLATDSQTIAELCKRNSRVGSLVDDIRHPRVWKLNGLTAYISKGIYKSNLWHQPSTAEALELNPSQFLARGHQPLTRYEQVRYRRMHVWNLTWAMYAVIVFALFLILSSLWRKRRTPRV